MGDKKGQKRDKLTSQGRGETEGEGRGPGEIGSWREQVKMHASSRAKGDAAEERWTWNVIIN